MADFPFRLRITAAEKITQTFDRITRSSRGMQAALRGVNNRFAHMAEVTARVRERTQQFGQHMVRVGTWITGATLGAAGASLYLLKRFTETADVIAKSAPRVGLSTDAFQQLSFAATLAGAGQETLNTGLTRFARIVNDADRGLQTAQRAMDGLGIRTLRTASGALRPMNELLFEAIDGFSGMRDSVKRTALAQEAFGRGGAKLLNFFMTGSREIRAQMDLFTALGGVINEETLQASERFNDNFEIMAAVLNTVQSSIAAGLLPILEKIQVRIIDWVYANKELIRTRIDAFIAGVVDGLQSLSTAAQKILHLFAGDGAVFGIDLQQLGKSITIIAGLTAVLGPLAIALGGVALVIAGLTSTIGIWAIAIAGIIALATIIYIQWDRIKQFFTNLWDKPVFSAQTFLFGPIAGIINAAKVVYRVWSPVAKFLADMWRRLTGNTDIPSPSTISSRAAPGRRIFNLADVQQSLDIRKTSEARVHLDFKNVPRGVDLHTENAGLDFLSTNLGFAGQF